MGIYSKEISTLLTAANIQQGELDRARQIPTPQTKTKRGYSYRRNEKERETNGHSEDVSETSREGIIIYFDKNTPKKKRDKFFASLTEIAYRSRGARETIQVEPDILDKMRENLRKELEKLREAANDQRRPRKREYFEAEAEKIQKTLENFYGQDAIFIDCLTERLNELQIPLISTRIQIAAIEAGIETFSIYTCRTDNKSPLVEIFFKAPKAPKAQGEEEEEDIF